MKSDELSTSDAVVKKLVLSFVFGAGVVLPLCAAEFIWKTDGRANDWDWTDSRNFFVKGTSTEGAPQASDVVFIPDGLTVYARTSDAAAFDRASSLERISPQGAGAHVVFDIGADEEKTIGCAVNAWTGYVSNSRNYGGIVKTGAGTLVLNRQGRDYYTTIEAREGSVKLVSSPSTYFLEHVIVSNGVTFFANPGGYTSAGRLNGDGVITNTVSKVFQLDERDMESRFSGVIAKGVEFYTSGKIDLTSEENTMNAFVVRYNYGAGSDGPVVGVAKFGKTSDRSSSVGVYQNLFVVDGGYLRYLGSGETTDKTLYFNTSSAAYPTYLDGGDAGGLVFSGALNFSAYNAKMHDFNFTGDNTTPCVFSGAVHPPSGSADFVTGITKSGTGTWRIKDSTYRSCLGGVTVLDGVLQFDSIDEAGKSSSLGYGTNLYERCSSMELDGSKRVCYAYLLGDTDDAGKAAGDALMEYMGEGSARVTTRPAVLNGKGGFKASSGALRFSGVSGLGDGENVLVLDGAGLTNEVQDVADGAGVVSVVKRGPGTWYMSGSNTFSGRLEVKAGTLHVRDPARYRWYRFNVKKLYNKNSSGESSADGNFLVWVFGLYDKDGNWLNGGMKAGGNGMNVLPGEACNGSLWNTWEKKWEYSSGTYGSLTNLFIDSTSNSSRFHVRSKDVSGSVLEPDPGNSDTWGRVVLRLPDDAPDAVSWDFVQSGYYCWASPYNVTTWSLEGSVDGLRWDELTATEDARGLWQSSGNGTYSFFWYYGREKHESGSAASHATGKAISSVKPDPLPCLDNVSSVSVAAGAVLKADATAAITLKGLTIDASGMGTLENFRLAENGVIDVVNLGEGSGPRSLPGTYLNVQGVENIAKWAVHVDGEPSSKAKIVVSDSPAGKCLTFVKPGMTVVIR